jgi:hypothetical protein
MREGYAAVVFSAPVVSLVAILPVPLLSTGEQLEAQDPNRSCKQGILLSAD